MRATAIVPWVQREVDHPTMKLSAATYPVRRLYSRLSLSRLLACLLARSLVRSFARCINQCTLSFSWSSVSPAYAGFAERTNFFPPSRCATPTGTCTARVAPRKPLESWMPPSYSLLFFHVCTIGANAWEYRVAHHAEWKIEKQIRQLDSITIPTIDLLNILYNFTLAALLRILSQINKTHICNIGKTSIDTFVLRYIFHKNSCTIGEKFIW